MGRTKREEEITEYASTHHLGIPQMWERASFARKLSQLFSQRALRGYRYLCITRSIF